MLSMYSYFQHGHPEEDVMKQPKWDQCENGKVKAA